MKKSNIVERFEEKWRARNGGEFLFAPRNFLQRLGGAKVNLGSHTA